MAPDAEGRETPAEKRDRRTGACEAVVCSVSCEAYMPALTMDGWQMCTCGHTRHVHALPEGTINS